MGRAKREQVDMFDDFVELTSYIGSLKGIVQNSEIKVSDKELFEWSEAVNYAINKLSSLREDIMRFYQD